MNGSVTTSESHRDMNWKGSDSGRILASLGRLLIPGLSRDNEERL